MDIFEGFCGGINLKKFRNDLIDLTLWRKRGQIDPLSRANAVDLFDLLLKKFFCARKQKLSEKSVFIIRT